jgi:hypothetical protein
MTLREHCFLCPALRHLNGGFVLCSMMALMAKQMQGALLVPVPLLSY